MRTTTLSTRFNSEEVALLDTLAKGAGQDRASIIKTLLRHGMAELRLTQALDAYRKGDVTLSRGAEMAGVSTWDLVARLEQAQVDLHYGPEELTSDLAAFDRKRR